MLLYSSTWTTDSVGAIVSPHPQASTHLVLLEVDLHQLEPLVKVCGT